MENSYSVEPQAEISFVIPVFNGARTIAAVVERIFEFYSDLESRLFW